RDRLFNDVQAGFGSVLAERPEFRPQVLRIGVPSVPRCLPAGHGENGDNATDQSTKPQPHERPVGIVAGKRLQDSLPSEQKTRQATQNGAANEPHGNRERRVWPLALFHNAQTPLKGQALRRARPTRPPKPSHYNTRSSQNSNSPRRFSGMPWHRDSIGERHAKR